MSYHDVFTSDVDFEQSNQTAHTGTMLPFLGTDTYIYCQQSDDLDNQRSVPASHRTKVDDLIRRQDLSPPHELEIGLMPDLDLSQRKRDGSTTTTPTQAVSPREIWPISDRVVLQQQETMDDGGSDLPSPASGETDASLCGPR
jgi:hypothetical protein